MSSFMQRCLKNDIMPVDYDSQIDDYVERWHDSKESGTIHEFLGMDQVEFAIWAEQPELLTTLIEARRTKKTVCTKLHPSKSEKSIHTDAEVLSVTEDWEYGQIYEKCRCNACGVEFERNR